MYCRTCQHGGRHQGRPFSGGYRCRPLSPLLRCTVWFARMPKLDPHRNMSLQVQAWLRRRRKQRRQLAKRVAQLPMERIQTAPGTPKGGKPGNPKSRPNEPTTPKMWHCKCSAVGSRMISSSATVYAGPGMAMKDCNLAYKLDLRSLHTCSAVLIT